MIFGRSTLGFLLVTIVALFCAFCAQDVEAAKSSKAPKAPKVTHKVYFDIHHGDKDLGRGESSWPSLFVCNALTRVSTVVMGLYGGVCAYVTRRCSRR